MMAIYKWHQKNKNKRSVDAYYYRVAIVWRAAVWSFTEEENTEKSSANLSKLVVVRTDSQSASTSGTVSFYLWHTIYHCLGLHIKHELVRCLP